MLETNTLRDLNFVLEFNLPKEISDDIFGDVWNISELETAIKNLKDGHTVIFDSDSGNVDVRAS